MKLYKKQALGAKIETTQDTAVVPSTSTDYLLIEDFDFTLDAEKLERDFRRVSVDPLPHVIGKRFAKFTFDVEIKGSGTAGDPTIAGYAGLHALLQGCGKIPVVAATQSVVSFTITNAGSGYTSAPTVAITSGGGTGATAVAVINSAGLVVAVIITNPGSGYTTDPTVGFSGGGGSAAAATASRGGSIYYGPTSAPASASFYTFSKSVTIEGYKDGNKHILSGAVGICKRNLESGNYGKFSFEFWGKYTAVTDVAVPSVTIVNVSPPVFESALLGTHGFAPVLSKLSVDEAGKISVRDDALSANSIKGFCLTDRKPKGSLQMEAETVAIHDVWGKVVASTQAPLAVKYGSVAGNQIVFAYPVVQYGENKYTNRDNFLDNAVSLDFSGNSGDDWEAIIIL